MPDRERIAAAQAALLSALLDEGPAPAGFDPDDVGFAGRMLREKRATVAAKQDQRQPPPAAPAGVWGRLLDRLRRRRSAPR